jgi:serine/threonine-protein kinase 19
MNNKRKIDSSMSDSVAKKAKSSNSDEKTKNDQTLLIDLLSKTSLELENQHGNMIDFSLNYFKSHFPSKQFDSNIPSLVLSHQIYALVKNRTTVDRYLEALRVDKKIIMFKSDDHSSNLINNGANNDLFICDYDEFKQFIDEVVKPNANEQVKWLVNFYLEKILPHETNELSIEKATLLIKYNLSEKDFTSLFKLGMLTIKSSTDFWFSVPFIGNFRRTLVDCRRNFLSLLRKQKFQEINVNTFFNKLVLNRNSNFKNIRKIGPIYLICDMLGKELCRKVVSPMGIVIKLRTD